MNTTYGTSAVLIAARSGSGNRLPAGHRHHRARMRGLTLIELMIALVITSLILLALTRVFVSTRLTYQTDEGLARLQENARFAIQFLTHDLRMTGNAGCMGEPRIDPDQPVIISHLNAPATPFGGTGTPDAFTIRGFDAVGPIPGVPFPLPPLYPPAAVSSTNPGLDADLAPWGAVGGSDVLVLRFQHGDAAPVDPTLTDPNQVAVIRPHNIQANQVVMVSDCSQAYIFQVTGVMNAGAVDLLAHANAGSPGNSCAIWGSCPGSARGPSRCAMAQGEQSYLLCPGAQVAQYRTVTYFIGSGGGGTPAARVPALYRAVFDESGVAQAEELVEGVENMQITYGQDTDGDFVADWYLTAPAVTDWTRVMTVRIGLLMATSYASGSSEVGADTTPFYEIGGMAQISVPLDHRRRKVVVETIKIRNRPIPAS